MCRFKRICCAGGLLLLSFCELAFAQIPDSLKTPYYDLLKLNNSGQYQEAILQGKLLVARAPEFPHAYEQLARGFEKAKPIEQGISYFYSLRTERPDNAYSYYALSLLEKGRKDYEEISCKDGS